MHDPSAIETACNACYFGLRPIPSALGGHYIRTSAEVSDSPDRSFTGSMSRGAPVVWSSFFRLRIRGRTLRRRKGDRVF